MEITLEQVASITVDKSPSRRGRYRSREGSYHRLPPRRLRHRNHSPRPLQIPLLHFLRHPRPPLPSQGVSKYNEAQATWGAKTDYTSASALTHIIRVSNKERYARTSISALLSGGLYHSTKPMDCHSGFMF